MRTFIQMLAILAALGFAGSTAMADGFGSQRLDGSTTQPSHHHHHHHHHCHHHHHHKDGGSSGGTGGYEGTGGSGN